MTDAERDELFESIGSALVNEELYASELRHRIKDSVLDVIGPSRDPEQVRKRLVFIGGMEFQRLRLEKLARSLAEQALARFETEKE